MEGWFDRLRAYLLASTLLFAGSLGAGWWLGASAPRLRGLVVEGVGEGFGWLRGVPWLALPALILANNALKCLGAVVLGVFFGVLPMALASFNGLLLGLVAYVVVEERGLLYLALSIAPHGVFELPAILLSAAIGMWEGWLVVRKLSGEEVRVGDAVRDGLKLYVRVVLPLLVVAAIIEGYVTPALLMLAGLAG